MNTIMSSTISPDVTTDKSSVPASSKFATSVSQPFASRKVLVAIDANVEDLEILAAGVLESAQVVILHSNQDGIEQITEALRFYPGITSLHIVSHGSPGCLYLGNTQLNLATLERYAWDLQTWFAPSLDYGITPSLLLYGCRVAEGQLGDEFVRSLHQLTGTDIAASTTNTGSKALQGNWELEVSVGSPQTSLAFEGILQEQYASVFASPGANNNSSKILLVSDTNGLVGVEGFLTTDGHTVTSVTNEFGTGSPHLNNLAFLNTFDFVIWDESGAGAGNIQAASVYSTLETYIQGGGHLLVTGYDTLASPADPQLAALVRSTMMVDTGGNTFTTNNVDHFALNGPFGDFRGVTVDPPYGDWDGARANTSAGAISLATFNGYDAIIYTELPNGGSVGYWTGGEYGSGVNQGKQDWKTPGASLNILRNWSIGIGSFSTHENSTPTISGVPAVSVDEDSAYSFTPSASDIDGDNLTFSITNKPSWASFDSQTGQLTGTPTNADVGTTAGIIISVSDGVASVDLNAFDLTVNNTNDAPTISGVPAVSVDEDSAYSFTPSASDIDGDNLTFSITNKPSWASFDSQTGQLTGTPTNADVGTTAGIIISVSDGVASVDLNAFDLTVNNTNDAPVLKTENADFGAVAGFAFSFTLDANTFVDDDANDTLSLKATLADGNPLPSWLKFDEVTGVFSGTPTFASVGTLGLKVTATDGDGSAIDDFLDLAIALPQGKTGNALRNINFQIGAQGTKLRGTNQAETLRGTRGSDVLEGLGGNDRLIDAGTQNGHGKDRMYGGGGDDFLFGGNGHDYLDGGNGDDRIVGGRARDLLIGGAERDVLLGDEGNDFLVGGTGADTLTGGSGKDMFVFRSLAEQGDVITDFDSSVDLIDLRSLLANSAFDAASKFAQYAQFIQLAQVGTGTQVRIDVDGIGKGTNFATLVTLNDTSITTVSSRNFVVSTPAL
jgi:Ca2+-binding RTX toxin-like protein